jgi:hypothetical protein
MSLVSSHASPVGSCGLSTATFATMLAMVQAILISLAFSSLRVILAQVLAIVALLPRTIATIRVIIIAIVFVTWHAQRIALLLGAVPSTLPGARKFSASIFIASSLGKANIFTVSHVTCLIITGPSTCPRLH